MIKEKLDVPSDDEYECPGESEAPFLETDLFFLGQVNGMVEGGKGCKMAVRKQEKTPVLKDLQSVVTVRKSCKSRKSHEIQVIYSEIRKSGASIKILAGLCMTNSKMNNNERRS